MNCPRCQSVLPAGAVYCPKCGMLSAPTPAGPTLSGQATRFGPLTGSSSTKLEIGSVFADRYQVAAKLGEGGMGIVYAATDRTSGLELVLKLIHPDLVQGETAVKRLMSEGLTAREIRHPNVVAVYDVSQWKGQPYFTMEYVRGRSLRAWLVENLNNDLDAPLDVVVGLIKGILAGLAEAHRMGIVHRDLKPENILLKGEPGTAGAQVKIVDFGIAKAVGTTRTSKTSLGAGGGAGTPLYMAPEQQTSSDGLKPSADFYAVSVMFYEMLMDALPQARFEPVSKYRQDVPAAIDALIEKGLSVRPRNRFQSAAEYSGALDVALGTKPGPQPVPPPVAPDPASAPAPQPTRARRGFVALVAVALPIAIVVLGSMVMALTNAAGGPQTASSWFVGAITIAFAAVWILAQRKDWLPQPLDGAASSRPSVKDVALGACAGIVGGAMGGPYEVYLLALLFLLRVPAALVAGTMYVGAAIPTMFTRWFYTFDYYPSSDIIFFLAVAAGGAWLGSALVRRLSPRTLALVLGVSLLMPVVHRTVWQVGLLGHGQLSMTHADVVGPGILGSFLFGGLSAFGFNHFFLTDIWLNLAGTAHGQAAVVGRAGLSVVVPVLALGFVRTKVYALRPALALTIGATIAMPIGHLIGREFGLGDYYSVWRWILGAVAAVCGVIVIRAAVNNDR